MMQSIRSTTFLVLFFSFGCSVSLLHYYDPTIYKNLAYLKPKVAALHESFVEEEIEPVEGRTNGFFKNLLELQKYPITDSFLTSIVKN